MLRWTPLAVSLLSVSVLCSCSRATLNDGRTPTGSQSLAASSDYKTLYVANSDDGTVSRVDLAGETASEIDVGSDPARVVRVGDRVLVTLRGERKIAVLTDDGAALKLDTTIQVGAEPTGMVASEDGTRVYVASALSNEVRELAGDTLETLRTFSIPDQPSWLALHPGGQSLYEASAMNGRLSHVALDDGEVNTVELPEKSTFTEFGQANLTARLTGDPSVTPDGENVLVPGIWVDNTTDIEEGESNVEELPSGYASGGRFNPGVLVIPVDGAGVPEGVEDIHVVNATSFEFGRPIAGYPASVTASPDSKMMLLTLEGAAAVVALPITAPKPSLSLFDVFRRNQAFEPGFEGLEFRAQASFNAPAGPRAATFVSDDDAWVYSFIDRKVGTASMLDARDRLGVDNDGDDDGFDRAPAIGVPFRPDGPSFRGGGFVDGALTISTRKLPEAVERGRRMFFAADDAKMASVGAGVSCATCHFNSRNDGLTWPFSRDGVATPRNTPSLAGKVSLTAPVRWDGSRTSVADDAFQTSQGLMGGEGLTQAQADDIEAYIDWTRDVDLPVETLSGDAVARGKAIFERPEVGCAACHSGARYTDNKTYKMLGIDAQTRALTGVAASAPYFHDGRAQTLEDVVKQSRTNGMGNTSMLDDRESADLVAYLRSL